MRDVSHMASPLHNQSRHTDSCVVLLLAGDRPGGDPLAVQFAVSSKSLVPVAGRPMLDHVLETLLAHPRVASVYVLTQAPGMLFADAWLARYLRTDKVHAVSSGNSIAGSISSVLRSFALDWPVLVTTADHVLLNRETLDVFLEQAEDCDAAVGLVERSVAAAEALDTGRTWVRFGDVAVTGANLFALNSPRVFAGLQYWQRLETHRKRPWRMAWELGPAFLLDLALRRLSLAEAFDAAGRKLGLCARPAYIPFARAGVDVDKAADHVLVEKLLAHECK